MKTLTRQASYNQFEGKFRVFFYQEAGAGFEVGNMLSMGHSDFESESQAQRAVSEWSGASRPRVVFSTLAFDLVA